MGCSATVSVLQQDQLRWSISWHIFVYPVLKIYLNKEPKALLQSIPKLNYHQHSLVCLISSLVTPCWNLSPYLLILHLGTHRAVYSRLYDGPFHTGWLLFDLSSVFSRLNDFIRSVFPHRRYCLQLSSFLLLSYGFLLLCVFWNALLKIGQSLQPSPRGAEASGGIDYTILGHYANTYKTSVFSWSWYLTNCSLPFGKRAAYIWVANWFGFLGFFFYVKLCTHPHWSVSFYSLYTIIPLC